MMISNWKKPFDLHGLYKKYSALSGLTEPISKTEQNTPELKLKLPHYLGLR